MDQKYYNKPCNVIDTRFTKINIMHLPPSKATKLRSTSLGNFNIVLQLESQHIWVDVSIICSLIFSCQETVKAERYSCSF